MKNNQPAQPSRSPPSNARSQQTDTKARPSPPSARPSLVARPHLSQRRNVPSRMSQTTLASPSPTGSQPSESPVEERIRHEESQDPLQLMREASNTTPPSAMDLALLKEAVNRIQNKGFTRTKSMPSAPASPKSNVRKSVLSSETNKSQQPISPSLEASFASPLATGAQTAHSESTESTESARTVRASAAPTPSAYPVRTPSYPFPYVPGSQMHQPFTILSPTVSSDQTARAHAVDRYSVSSRSTPLGAPSFFGPTGSNMPQADNGLPVPNLYDVVLQLNAEPTLAAWWGTLTAVLREHYRVQRASIAIPADTTDIENVPWGQKTSYNVAGLKDISAADLNIDRSDTNSTGGSSSSKNDSLHNRSRSATVRPAMESRHSFAGYEIGGRVPEAEESRFPSPVARPTLDRRRTSHVSMTRTPSWTESMAQPDSPAFPSASDISGRPPYAEDLEHENPTTVVLPMLRALNRERDPLLDTTGVNRVVQRSKMVILTRDYSTTPQEPLKEAEKAATSTKQEAPAASAGFGYNPQPPHKNQKAATSRFFQGTNYHTTTGRLSKTPNYEEYEQFPSSPWSQSPAPSPAIQQDADHNPFFSSGTLDESTFSPTPVNENYSNYGQVEAIGIDSASTIIHIPLIHPLLSRTLRVEQDTGVEANQSKKRRKSSKQTDSTIPDYKAPIAILSILSPDVPYGQHLTQSLKHLAPHLATSFQTSYQNTTLQERVAGAIQRQQRSGHAAPGSLALPGNRMGLGLGLESLLQFDDDTLSSTVGSIASPSEYSSKSRNSPPGSKPGTPGLDTLVPAPKHNVPATTPGVGSSSEGFDNYFDMKKRKPLNRAKSGISVNQSASAQAPNRLTSEHRTALRKLDTSPSNREPSESRKEGRKLRLREEKQSPSDSSPTARRATQPGSATDQDDVKHTYLHSHGADFNTSFQSLPAATVPRTPGLGSHSRSLTTSEAHDMPPPSERLLRTIIDSLPVQIFTAAPLTGKITWVNSKFLVYRGQSAQEVLDDPWSTVHPDDLEAFTADWSHCLHTGQQFQHKLRLRRFDDFYRFYYVRAAPLRDKLQNIVHWVGTMIDLHDQHIAEVNASKQLETAASEAKYRALANSSPQIVFAATRGRGVTFCNSQWVTYSGQTEEQARGTGFMEHVFPEDLIKCKLPIFDESGENASNVPTTVPTPVRRSKSGASVESEGTDTTLEPTASGALLSPEGMQLPQRKLSELASTGILRVLRGSTGRPSYSTEVRLRMKSGEYRWHLVRVLLAEPLLSADAEEETWYGTCTDINDHKELEQTLKETMDAKSRFLSNMSHEIRTPLNGIHGMANFLIDSNLTAEQLDQVNVIRASTEGLRDLINDILDLSKVEAGMITLDMNWLHIRSVIEEVNDLTSSLALDKGIELNYVVEEKVPSMIKGDKFRFRQVLLNVIGNAIKFTSEGEVCIRCTTPAENIEPGSDSVMLKFEVIDTGRGFSEKEAEKLFKRFSQIDASSTRQHGGTGLGLVISMQLVELHGGHMSASSKPGQGSTFTFTMKFGLPTDKDRPEVMPQDNNVLKEKDVQPDKGWPTQVTAVPGGAKGPQTKQVEISISPGFYAGLEKRTSHDSPGLSSDSSRGSLIPTSQASMASSRSSISVNPGSPIELQLPTEARDKRHHDEDANKDLRDLSQQTPASPGIAVKARLYSILVVCPLKWTREATVGHLNSVLDHHVPHTVTSKATMEEAKKLLLGPDSFTFSHLLVNLPDIEQLTATINMVLGLPASSTSLVIISDAAQRKELTSRHPHLDFEKLQQERRLQFIQKPVKPSRLAVIFDPEKSRELSTDQNQHSAQQIALSQKKVFDEMTRRLGNKDIKVLLVEDNRINQMVMLKLLRRVSVAVETCFDGVQATDKVLGKPPGYFSIILLDLMMPNKDGYQTCRDIRAWEKKNRHPNIPIVALSANVLDDVWQKCMEAGFNSYLTKPVEFKELSDVMTKYLDPEDKDKPIEFMQGRPDVGGRKRS